MKYILMRFWGGGGLARQEVIECNEEELHDKCAEFEQECANSNEGVSMGILDEKELRSIFEELND